MEGARVASGLGELVPALPLCAALFLLLALVSANNVPALDERSVELKMTLSNLGTLLAEGIVTNAEHEETRKAALLSAGVVPSRRSRMQEISAACGNDAATKVMNVCCPASQGGQHHRRLGEHLSCALPKTCPSLQCATEFEAFFGSCKGQLGFKWLNDFMAFGKDCHRLQHGEAVEPEPKPDPDPEPEPEPDTTDSGGADARNFIGGHGPYWQACENHGYNEDQCGDLECCHFNINLGCISMYTPRYTASQVGDCAGTVTDDHASPWVVMLALLAGAALSCCAWGPWKATGTRDPSVIWHKDNRADMMLMISLVALICSVVGGFTHNYETHGGGFVVFVCSCLGLAISAFTRGRSAWSLKVNDDDNEGEPSGGEPE